MKPEEARLFSIQVEIIRLIQTANGQSACYAEPVNGECGKIDCVWRNDCMDEAGEMFPSLRSRKTGVAKSFNIPAGIARLLQTDDGQNA